MSNANYCTHDQILIRCLLTELLSGVRPDTENVVREVPGMGMVREATQGANGKYAV